MLGIAASQQKIELAGAHAPAVAAVQCQAIAAQRTIGSAIIDRKVSVADRSCSAHTPAAAHGAITTDHEAGSSMACVSSVSVPLSMPASCVGPYPKRTIAGIDECICRR